MMMEGSFPGWTPVVGDALDEIRTDLEQRLDAPLPDEVTLLEREVGCYPDYRLMRARLVGGPTGTRESYFLYKPGDPVPLDWTSTPIHELNERALVIEDAEQAEAYLRFFCFGIAGDEGRFFITESLEDLPLLPDAEFEDERATKLRETLAPLRRLPNQEGDAEYDYRFAGSVLYGDALFDAEFKLDRTGTVEMVDDTPVEAELPVVRDRLGSDRYFVLVRSDAPRMESEVFLREIRSGNRVQDVRVLGHVDARGEVFDKPIDVANVTFNGDVTFEGARFECPVQLDRCDFRGTLDLQDARLESSFIAHRASVGRNAVSKPGEEMSLRGARIRVEGTLDLRGSTVRGGVDFQGARIDSNLFLAGMDIAGWTDAPWGEDPGSLPVLLDLMGSEIGGDLDFFTRPAELARRGDPADTVHDLLIPGFSTSCTVIRGWVVASRLKAGGVVILSGLRVHGEARFDLSTLEGGLTTDPVATRQRFICQGTFILTFSRIRGTVDLENIYVEGSVHLYETRIDGSVYARCSSIAGGLDRRAVIYGDFDCSGLSADDVELEGAEIGGFRMITGDVGRLRLLPGLEPLTEDPAQQVEDVRWRLHPCTVRSLTIQTAKIRHEVIFSGLHVEPFTEVESMTVAEIRQVECGGAIKFWTRRVLERMTALPADWAWADGMPDVYSIESRFPTGLDLSGVTTTGELNLVNVKSLGDIRINDCTVGHDLDLGSHGPDSAVREGQTTTHCTGLQLEATVCNGDADLSGLRAMEPDPDQPADVLARRLQVAGKLLFSRPLKTDRDDFFELSEDADQRVEAMISGRLDLSVGEASHLVISGDSFQENKRERGISFERGTFRRFQVLFPFPACHDPSDISVERWEIPDRYLLSFLEGSRPLRRSTYLGVEQVLRNDGNDELADEVFRALRWRVLDEATFETRAERNSKRAKAEADDGESMWGEFQRRVSFNIRNVASRFLGVAIGWGTQSFKPLILGALLMPMSVWVFSAPQNIIPTTALLEVTPGLDHEATPTDYGFDWGIREGFWVAVRYHIPVVPVFARDRFEPSIRETHLVLPGGDRQITIRRMAPEDYAFMIYLLHWVIWPLFLIGITTKVIRERA